MFVTLTGTRFERSLSPVLDVVHEWLDWWSGIGVSERGMARQGYDLQLTRYANEGWRATFLSHRPRALHDAGARLSLGADAVGRGANRGMGGAEEARASGLIGLHRPGWVYEEKMDGWRLGAYKSGWAGR